MYEVRIRVADVLAKLSGILAKDVSVSKLTPILVSMFADDHKVVRETTTTASVEFIKNIGSESLNTFLPLYKKCLEDDKWRVRYEAYDAI